MGAPTSGDFGRLLLAEWTKLRSVPRWMMTLAAAVLLTVLVAVLGASASRSEEAPAGGSGEAGEAGPGPGDGPGGPPSDRGQAGGDAVDFSRIEDSYHLLHQPLTGDGTITARVVDQADSHEWAKAGLLVKARTEPGAPYAAVMVTPDHGVRFQADFTLDEAGSDGRAPRWLRLVRAGDRVTGYESTDGEAWTEVGSAQLTGLPATVEVGLFVTSPPDAQIERQFGGESISEEPTRGEASFDRVRLEAATSGPPSGAAWTDHDASMLPGLGSSEEVGGVFTLTGSGDIGERDRPGVGDDVVQTALAGILVGLLAVAALGVLFVTAEYRRDMMRTTLTAAPRRGRVLAAKAVVLGGTTFAAGLVASLGSFLVAKPILRSNGFRPPLVEDPSLTDGPVMRAVVGSAVLLALVAVLSLALGTLLRRSAPAVTVVMLAVVLPPILGDGLPVSVAKWVTRLTPSAGFAVQETVERYDTAIGPLAGLAVLGAYTAVAYGAAAWRLQRRDG